ncbi:hypothetical protein WM40_05585 [Robbsia andropogonis]|uniref:Uncharacterized protein n=1 Tax=Robbsia andropogonis TaxID=28092 RepID=A0A0F5K2P3_9BURK|nr:hypothetical protein [Robbsia andropogonis]KKB64396.1 hypothetical protein WM40_05585 [Robbsia andropogonis]MCP1118923.1 hypothetical protein [Robbsia andropogonis]MCP1128725.1 hypothetical protein [Robbsia andropogonis]
MLQHTQSANQPHPSNVEPDAIPPARKENGDIESDGTEDRDVIGSPNDPTSDPKKPSTEAS